MSPERIRPGSARARQVSDAPVEPTEEQVDDRADAATPGAEVTAPAAVAPAAPAVGDVAAPADELGRADEGDVADEPVDTGDLEDSDGEDSDLEDSDLEDSDDADDAAGDGTLPNWGASSAPVATAPAGAERARTAPPTPAGAGRSGTQRPGRGAKGRSARVRVEESPQDEVLAVSRRAPVADEHLGWFKKLYFGRTHIDFVRRRKLWFTISSVLILAGAISLGVRGLNLSIDFVGGTSWTVPAKTLHVGSSQAVNEARKAVTPFGLGGATITELGIGQNSTIQVSAKVTGTNTAVNSQTLRSEVATALGKMVGRGPEAVSITQVGPSWGSEITSKAIEALIVFFILIAIYIAIFFEWRMALAAILAVAHDVMVVIGIYSLSGLEVTPDTVVAVLTILGYSLYDTIVVFDRVRDNIRSLGPSNKLTISDIVNLSMNQTLARSVNTSLVAVLPILAVLVLGAEVLGATTLEYFGFALLIGLLSGAYSSIFIASPLVAVMKEREQRWRNVRERLARRGGDRLLLSPADIAAGVLDGDGGLRNTRAEQRRAGAGRITPGGAVATEEAELDPEAAVVARRGPSRSGARVASRPAGGRPPARARRKGGRR